MPTGSEEINDGNKTENLYLLVIITPAPCALCSMGHLEV